MSEARSGVRPGLVALFLFGSGFCALVYQTVWLRELRDVFGASTAATAAVVGIFMAGLGVGGLRLGRTADRSENPLNLYAMLELGVTLTSAATIPLLLLVEKIYYATGGTVSLGLSGASLLRLVLSVILLGAPTFLMGGTLPAAARSIVGVEDVRRRSIAMLYGVNTLGAVAGALAATFFALELFGNRQTLLIAILLNGIVVVVARAHARQHEPEAADHEETAPDASVVDARDVSRSLVYAGAVITGFVFMLMEMVWYRVLAPVLGGSTFTFGLILATALAGIGLGGLAYSLVETKRPATVALFGLTCALEALAIALPFALGDRIAVFAVFLQPMGAYGFIGRVIGWAIITGIVVAPASIVAGFQFPLLIGLAGRARRNVGLDVGRVYAFNTGGAILGSLSGGFGLMPLLSAESCWALSVWILVVLSAGSAIKAFQARERAWGGLVVAAISGCTLLLSTGPTAVWRHSPIGAGRVNKNFESKTELRDWQRQTRRTVVWQKDGVESAVAVVNGSGYAFLINGKTDGHATGDAGTQVMGGLIGAIQHDNPRRSLVVGLGTGSTAGWLASVPGMERVDVAELEPSVIRVAEFCEPVNEDVLEKSNVKIYPGDAREILLASNDRYDLIFSEPSNPYRAGIASLFTKDFYDAARGRLNDSGLFMQWVQGYEITPRTMETILATIQSIFPYVQIWETLPNDKVIVASATPIPVRYDLIRNRLQQEPYRRAAAVAWKVNSLEEFLAHYVADQRLIEATNRERTVEINTDDRNVVEFGFARSVGVESSPLKANLRDVARALRVDDLRGSGVDPELLRRFTVTSRLLAPAREDLSSSLSVAREAYRSLDFGLAARAWEATGLAPATHSEALLFAHSLAEIGGEACLAQAEVLERYSTTEATIVRAIYETRRRTPEADLHAAELFVSAFEDLLETPWVDNRLIKTSLVHTERLAKRLPKPAIRALVDALENPFSVSLANEVRMGVTIKLSVMAEARPCGEQTLRALGAFEPNPPLNESLLRLRVACYTATDSPLAVIAKSDLEMLLGDKVEEFGSLSANPPSTLSDFIPAETDDPAESPESDQR